MSITVLFPTVRILKPLSPIMNKRKKRREQLWNSDGLFLYCICMSARQKTSGHTQWAFFLFYFPHNNAVLQHDTMLLFLRRAKNEARFALWSLPGNRQREAGRGKGRKREEKGRIWDKKGKRNQGGLKSRESTRGASPRESNLGVVF